MLRFSTLRRELADAGVHLNLLKSIEWSQLLSLCKVVASTSQITSPIAAKTPNTRFCSLGSREPYCVFQELGSVCTCVCVRVCVCVCVPSHIWCDNVQGCHYLAEHKEAKSQLKQQLAEDTSLRQQLKRQLQGKLLRLKQAMLINAEHERTQQAQQHHTAVLQGQLNGAEAALQDERHISAQLQAALDGVRLEAQTEHNNAAQTQRYLETVSTELRDEQQQKNELQLQLSELRGQFQAEQQHSTEVSQQLSRARVKFGAEQKLSSQSPSC